MSKPKILVTGATGKTGLPTALSLLEQGFPVRALVRSDDTRAAHLRDRGAEIEVGSLENYADLENAMRGVLRAYFCPPLEPGTLRRATLFATAAREAKLETVVLLSQWVADAQHPAVHAREKWLTNKVFEGVREVGVVTIQPGWFADNYFVVLGQAAQFGLFGLPLGQGLNAPPSNEDIARVVVACLINPAPHIGKAYRPTGPKLLTPSEIAEAVGRAVGRRVKYQNVPLPLFLKAASALAISPFVISQLYWFLLDYQSNAFGLGAPTEAVEEIAGVPPEGFDSIARRYVRASPRAAHGFSAALGEASDLLAALRARKPDIDQIEAQLGAPHLAGYVLARDSPAWMATHGAQAQVGRGR